MGLNIAKLRKKMKKMNDSMNGGNITYYKPEKGRNVIRVLPAKDGGDDFYKEVLTHYNLNRIGMEDKSLTCLRTDPKAKSCPLCESAKMLMNSDNKGDQNVGKRIKSTERFYLNVCLNSDRDEDNEHFNDVMVWNCPKSVFNEMLKSIIDPDYLDEDTQDSMILDPEEGYDFVVEVTPPKNKHEYQKYDVRVRPKTSAVHIKDWKDKLNDLSQFGKTISEKEMMEKIDGEDTDNDDESDSDHENDDEKEEEESHHKIHRNHHSEDNDDEELDERPRKHQSHSHHRHPFYEEEEDNDDDEDETVDLDKEIEREAKKISGGRASHKNHRKHDEDEDEDDYDDEEDSDDPF